MIPTAVVGVGQTRHAAKRSDVSMPGLVREAALRALADAVSKAKPSGAKGTYLKRIALSSTMGPGIKLDVQSVVGEAG